MSSTSFLRQLEYWDQKIILKYQMDAAPTLQGVFSNWLVMSSSESIFRVVKKVHWQQSSFTFWLIFYEAFRSNSIFMKNWIDNDLVAQYLLLFEH